ncbi:MAG TPA: DUF6350 family protein [Cellulomonas sp.]
MSTAPGTRSDRRASGSRGPRRRSGSRPEGGADSGGSSTFFVSELDGAPRWVGGMLAGLQGALLSLLVVVLPAIAVYVATSATPTAQGVPWTQAFRVGAGLWLLAHGVPLTVAPTVTLVPLGLTALALFSCYASARRSGYATRSALGAGVGAYVAVLAVVGLLIGAPLLRLLLGLLGGAVVAALGTGAGLLRRPEAPRLRDLLAPVSDRLPEPVRRGLLAGTAASALLVLLAAALTVVWVLTGRSTILEVMNGLSLDTVGGLVLAVGELAYLPTLVVWALSWLAGPGFAVGTGTSFSTAGVTSGALPAVPLLGALPAPDVSGGILRVVPVVTVLVGAGVAVVLRRRLVTTRARDPLLAGGVLAGTAGLAAGLLGVLATGGIGPGRMADLGPTPVLLALAVLVGVGAGALLVLLPGDPHVRSAVASAGRRTWALVVGRGRADVARVEPIGGGSATGGTEPGGGAGAGGAAPGDPTTGGATGPGSGPGPVAQQAGPDQH